MSRSTQTLGIVGTMVLDRIVSERGEVAEGWGGIGYAAAAAAATLPPQWGVRLVSRVGRDLAAEASACLATIPRCDARLTVVDEPNNRVELVYHDPDRRTERLTGGVSGWESDALAATLEGCDAVLVNFISGYELNLDTARALREAISCPLYADLHSLLLGIDADGVRTPRPLERWKEWVSCFDIVQMNEAEFSLLQSATDGPMSLSDILDAGPTTVAVTRGPRGASVVSRADGRTRCDEVTLVYARTGDPTGCGDIWGAVMFGRLLAGSSGAAAAATANRMAAASLDHRGVEGLVERLADVPLDDRAGDGLESSNEVVL